MNFEVTESRRSCETCGCLFDAAIVVGASLRAVQRHCDPCVEDHDRRMERMTNPEGEKQKKQLRKSCVPEGYQDYDPDQLPERTLALAKRHLFTWNFGRRGVGLGGPSDVGKSYVVFELARRWQDTGKNVLVIKDQDISRIVRENSPERDRMLAQLKHAEIVVWDDFGLSKMTDAVEGTYNDILESCYSKAIPILGTCNYSGEATKEKWAEQMNDRTFLEARGERIVRRFRDCCDVRVLN